MSDVSKTNAELIAELREEAIDADDIYSEALWTRAADALESATRLPAIDAAMIERFKQGWNAANNMDLFGGRVHAGLVAALDGAPEPEYDYRWIKETKFITHIDHVEDPVRYIEFRGLNGGEIQRRRKAGPWEPIKGE